ncbi:pumilio homolog 1-like [Triticum urartu]|uniref:PUM-HD domain-containing protein n=1 Tax=Triticum urartu TaxID=4572 RepID=A0A8R7R7B9_TRIUA|nr:pumilio homolog 1-like [Triticum urartu]
MDNKGKSKAIDGYVQTTSHFHRGSGIDSGKEIWEDDAATIALGGRQRDMSLFLSFLDEQDDPKSEEESTLHNQKLLQIGDTYINPFQPVNSSASTTNTVVKDYTELHSQIPLPNMDVIQDLCAQSSSSSLGIVPSNFANMMAIQEACLRALIDPDQEVSYRLWRQSREALKNHYALDVEMACSMGHVPNINAPGNSEFNSLLKLIKNPVNQSMRLINVKGHVSALSADPIGSCFIQQKLDEATTGEIVMLYKEITPSILTLATIAFPTYVVQKLLEHGPPVYFRILIANLMGHVLDLSLHLYGCRVIQKAFEISEIDQQIEMAKELDSNLFKCICDQHANHAVQKCMECVQPQYIQFIYRRLCGKAKMLSTHPYGCHVVQKMLEFCKDPKFMDRFIMEILDCARELSVDPYGNYVVQYIVEHGGPRHREIIMLKFAGRIVQMSHQKHSSKVIEKCLIYGSYHDCKLLINEILCVGGGQTADHIVGMIVHQYANNVVRQMIDVVNDWQFNVIVDVLRRNRDTLVMYAQGRQVIAQVERLLNGMAPSPDSLVQTLSSQFI